MTFSDFKLNRQLLNAIDDAGYEQPTPIQEQAIPLITAGHDVLGIAQTGTGKTAAFGIPLIDLIDLEDRHTQGLILCPTRELAVQVGEEIKKLAKFKRGLYVGTVYGGDSIERQIRELKKGLHVVIGTPGRVIDHLERGTLKVQHLKMMVLDEADEMLDMGFREDIENVLERTPEERQTVLFSATMSKPIMAMTNNYLRNPKLVKVVKNELTNQNIEQLFFDVKGKAKMEVMCRLMDFYQLKLMLVFCNTKARVDEVVENLLIRGYQAEGLHGDMRQVARTNVMTKFRSGNTNILVATDVAARGIDVDDVDAVINYDIPLDEEYYVHRIGRTGRAGRTGKAFTLVVGAERNRLRDVMSYTKVKIEKGVIPSFSDIVGLKKARFMEQIQEILTANEGLDYYEDVFEHLHHTGGFSASQIVAALTKVGMGGLHNEFGDENLDGEIERQLRRANDGNRYGNDRYGSRSGSSSYGRGEKDGGSYGNRGGRDERGGYGNRREGGYAREGGYERKGERNFGRQNAESRDDRPRTNREGGTYRRSSGDTDMVKIMLSIGKSDKITPSHIVGAISGEAGINGGSIGHIELQERVTFVDIPSNIKDKVVKAMDGNTIKGLRVRAKLA